MKESILTLKNIKVNFRTLDGIVEAVKGVNLDVKAGETVAIVGESGSGKSQLMMGTMGLLASNGMISGEASYRGTNLIGLPKQELNTIRGRKIAMIFQEPMTSLDPLYTIGNQLIEPIMHHQKIGWDAANAHAIEMLNLVKITEPKRRMESYPHEMSGGQRQRVMIAMALANGPDLLIADEPTTALDVTIQLEILELMVGLQLRLGMSMIFITHNLNILRLIADRIMVMRYGEVVEEGELKKVLKHPSHPYTKALIDAEPSGRKAPPAAKAPENPRWHQCLGDLSKLAADFSPARPCCSRPLTAFPLS